MKQIITTSFLCIIFTLSALAQDGQVFETRTVKSNILKMERKYSIYNEEESIAN